MAIGKPSQVGSDNRQKTYALYHLYGRCLALWLRVVHTISHFRVWFVGCVCFHIGFQHAQKMELALRRSLALVACFVNEDIYNDREEKATSKGAISGESYA